MGEVVTDWPVAGDLFTLRRADVASRASCPSRSPGCFTLLGVRPTSVAVEVVPQGKGAQLRTRGSLAGFDELIYRVDVSLQHPQGQRGEGFRAGPRGCSDEESVLTLSRRIRLSNEGRQVIPRGGEGVHEDLGLRDVVASCPVPQLLDQCDGEGQCRASHDVSIGGRW